MTTTTTPTTKATVSTVPVRLYVSDNDPEDPYIRSVVVTGWPVAPGLAINVTLDDNGQRLDGRYSLTHLPSGQALARRLCARHVDQAAVAAIATGVDWTADAEQIVADERTRPLRPGMAIWDWCGYDHFCRAEAYPRPDSPTYSTSQ
ncbi:hypothetical protein GA0070622_6415 [Micromonospora sediminicola]|uniref:Uncharacterized protein n=1 Tax=Micromonospora sediminicola TaxID=946078 RepID=A0A1A9BJP0_9ACTN|nr:hypothetical protein [Micromonospora sediminicola]SBT69291.1 hypothetical protein GA0070622_6415 [Micromonospora sediminicola]